MQSEQSTVSIIFLGGVGVGKTCLINRFILDDFQITEQTTNLGYTPKEVNFDGRIVKLDIFDTAGQEKYEGAIPNIYFRNANVAIICFTFAKTEDSDNKDKILENAHSSVNKYLRMVDEKTEGCKVILAGTKIDLYEDQQNEANNFMDEFESECIIGRILTSAKDGSNVEDLFKLASSCDVNEMYSNEPKLNDNPEPKKSCCGH